MNNVDGWTLKEMRKKPNFNEDFALERAKLTQNQKDCDLWEGKARCHSCGGRLLALSGASILCTGCDWSDHPLQPTSLPVDWDGIPSRPFIMPELKAVFNE